MSGDPGLACMVALDAPIEIGPAGLARAVRQVAPRARVAIERRPAEAGQSAVFAVVDYHRFVVATVAGALPTGEIAVALDSATLWPEGRERMQLYPAMAVIASCDPVSDPVELRAQAAAMTRLAAATAELGPARGLYWRGGETVTPPTRLEQAAAGLLRGEWPVDIWIGHQLYGEERDGVLTLGAQSRGAAEFIGIEADLPPARVRSMTAPVTLLYAALAQMMDVSHSLGNGQQIELTGAQRARFTIRLDVSGQGAVAKLQAAETARGAQRKAK